MFKILAIFMTDSRESPDKICTYWPYYMIFLITYLASGLKLEWVLSKSTSYTLFPTTKNNSVPAFEFF